MNRRALILAAFAFSAVLIFVAFAYIYDASARIEGNLFRWHFETFAHHGELVDR